MSISLNYDLPLSILQVSSIFLIQLWTDQALMYHFLLSCVYRAYLIDLALFHGKLLIRGRRKASLSYWDKNIRRSYRVT